MKLSPFQRRRHTASNKGFNLIEAAIVLGIVGLVVGGIWVAATSVYGNLRTKQSSDQLIQIVQGVRSLYATSRNIGVLAAVDMTPDVAHANVLPRDILTTTPQATLSTNTINAWGGNVGVVAENAASATRFLVRFTAVPVAACKDFVMRNAGDSHDASMIGVVGSGGGAAAGAAFAAPAGGQILTPGVGMSSANADTECTSAAGGGNATRSIAFLFNLKG